MAKSGDTQQQQQSQNSKTDPWAPAVPALNDLLSKYSGLSTDVTGAQSGAAGNLVSATSGIPNFGGAASGAVSNLLNSSTTPQVGMLTDAYKGLNANIGADASGANLDPYKTPGFSDALNTLTSNITNATKGVYAGSGRDPSGAGSFAKSLGIGLLQGEAPVLQSQYNANKGVQQNAANTLYNAGNTTAGNITGQQQVPLTNAAQGVGLIPSATGAYTAPGAAQLGAANTQYQLPYSNIGMLQNPIAQIAGLGGSSSGSGTATTTQQQSLLSNILGGASGAIGLASFLSDRDSKENIEEVGELHDGQKVMRFNYKGSPKTQIGLIAQDVAKVEPDAVDEIPQIGMLAVNYKTATNRAARMAHHRRAA